MAAYDGIGGLKMTLPQFIEIAIGITVLYGSVIFIIARSKRNESRKN